MPGKLMRCKIVIALLFSATASAVAAEITVFKTKTCGCCGKWVEHIRSSGFKVAVIEVSSTGQYRQRYGVPEKLQSCHTAVVMGYTIEGHVPAAEIQRLMKEKPTFKGLAVAGMPAGAPGMEGARHDAYIVIRFEDNGSSSSYHQYPGEGR